MPLISTLGAGSSRGFGGIGGKSGPAGIPLDVDISYSGQYIQYTGHSGPHQITAIGGGGGTGAGTAPGINEYSSWDGGNASAIIAEVDLQPSDTLEVFVAQGGQGAVVSTGGAGGASGPLVATQGGQGGTAASGNYSNGGGGGGGGATSVYLNGTAIIVAAGGGGSGGTDQSGVREDETVLENGRHGNWAYAVGRGGDGGEPGFKGGYNQANVTGYGESGFFDRGGTGGVGNESNAQIGGENGSSNGSGGAGGANTGQNCGAGGGGGAGWYGGGGGSGAQSGNTPSTGGGGGGGFNYVNRNFATNASIVTASQGSAGGGGVKINSGGENDGVSGQNGRLIISSSAISEQSSPFDYQDTSTYVHSGTTNDASNPDIGLGTLTDFKIEMDIWTVTSFDSNQWIWCNDGYNPSDGLLIGAYQWNWNGYTGIQLSLAGGGIGAYGTATGVALPDKTWVKFGVEVHANGGTNSSLTLFQNDVNVYTDTSNSFTGIRMGQTYIGSANINQGGGLSQPHQGRVRNIRVTQL
jgi:hypothetical protein